MYLLLLPYEQVNLLPKPMLPLKQAFINGLQQKDLPLKLCLILLNLHDEFLYQKVRALKDLLILPS
jgi:hypothetical protein